MTKVIPIKITQEEIEKVANIFQDRAVDEISIIYFAESWGIAGESNEITSMLLTSDYSGFMQRQRDDALKYLGVDQDTIDFLQSTDKSEIEKIKKMAKLKSLKNQVEQLEQELSE